MINSMFVGKSILNFFVVLFLTATSTFAAGGGDNYVKDYNTKFMKKVNIKEIKKFMMRIWKEIKLMNS